MSLYCLYFRLFSISESVDILMLILDLVRWGRVYLSVLDSTNSIKINYSNWMLPEALQLTNERLQWLFTGISFHNFQAIG